MTFTSTLTWTNWTFGFWWPKKLRAGGIDIGPVEFVWRKPRPGRRRAR